MFALLSLLGCQLAAVRALPDDRQVLAIGDSLLAWHRPRGQSIPDYLSLELGTRVLNRAVNGSQVLTAPSDPTAIPNQYLVGDWSWVVIDGGGNDLNQACTCGVDCGPVLDALLDPDEGAGAMPELVQRALDDGASVALIGYYPIPPSGWYGLGECGGAIEALSARYEAWAGKKRGVTFVDFGEVVRGYDKDPEAYDFDHVHPDPAGAEALGELLAEVIGR
jgi:acyl-CoA thioesterase-1